MAAKMKKSETLAFDQNTETVADSIASDTYKVFVQKRVIAREPRSSFPRALSNKLREFNNFEKNWDGQGANPIDFQCARFTEHVLDQISRDDMAAPSLVPLSSGCLQFEWHCGGYDIEVEIAAPLKIYCYRNNLETGDEEEMQLEADLLPLIEWLDEMAARLA